jgi:hypothetical protein
MFADVSWRRGEVISSLRALGFSTLHHRQQFQQLVCQGDRIRRFISNCSALAELNRRSDQSSAALFVGKSGCTNMQNGVFLCDATSLTN